MTTGNLTRYLTALPQPTAPPQRISSLNNTSDISKSYWYSTWCNVFHCRPDNIRGHTTEL